MIFILSIIFVSCSKDDDNPSNSNQGDLVLGYAAIMNKEFKMWVGGTEVPTSSLEVTDYMREDSYDFFDPAILQQGVVEFIGDSVIVNLSDSDSESKYPYRFSNDSLFITYPSEGEVFTATGTKQSLNMEQGYCYAYNTNGAAFQWRWRFLPMRFDFENSRDHHYWDQTDEMDQQDTLIIYNQTLFYN
jgi:hypothetical protein